MKAASYSLSLLVLFAVGAASLAATPITANSPPARLELQFQPPNRYYLLGTDQFGRDNLSRLALGGRRTLGNALFATILALGLGVMTGSVAGANGGWIDSLIMRGMDVLLALPGFMLGLVLVAALGVGGWVSAVGVGLALTPGMSRLVRGLVLSIRAQPFIEAAEALGADKMWIVTKHLFPNLMRPVVGFTGVIFAWSLLALASLEFLGLVGSPSDPSWGRMLADGRMYLRSTPWIALPPGLLIVAIVLAILRVSDSIRLGS